MPVDWEKNVSLRGLRARLITKGKAVTRKKEELIRGYRRTTPRRKAKSVQIGEDGVEQVPEAVQLPAQTTKPPA